MKLIVFPQDRICVSMDNYHFHFYQLSITSRVIKQLKDNERYRDSENQITRENVFR